MTTPESKAVQELREWTKHYGFVPVIKAAEAVLTELAKVTAERDALRSALETAIRAYAAKGIKLTWAIEALKGDK